MTQAGDKQTAAALKWLYEIEMVDSPTLKLNVVENIFLADKAIKDCSVFILPTFTYQKGVLVYVKLSWFANIFKKDGIYNKVEAVVNELLPSYNVRVVDDFNILKLSQQRIEETYGGQNERTKDSNITGIDRTYNESGERPELRETSDILPDSEEQTDDKEVIRDGAEQRNLQDDEKAQDPG